MEQLDGPASVWLNRFADRVRVTECKVGQWHGSLWSFNKTVDDEQSAGGVIVPPSAFKKFPGLNFRFAQSQSTASEVKDFEAVFCLSSVTGLLFFQLHDLNRLEVNRVAF